MDINPCGQSVSPDVISLQTLQFPEVQEQSINGVTDEALINDLENNLGKFLHVQDATESECTSGEDDTGFTEEGLCEDLKYEAKLTEKYLSKSATTPSPSETSESDASSDEDLERELQGMFDNSSKHPVSPAVTLPTPLNLVSAMKGSREKQGLSPKNLTVTWASDVYDPPPTILYHMVMKGKKQQKTRNKKTAKYKQKGETKQKGGSSSKKRSGGKDKKQLRKIVGSSNRCYKSLDARERLVSSDYDDGLDDFDVVGTDSYCGSSFLKKSPAKVHYSMGEAL